MNAAALRCLDLGWVPVRVAERGKKPIGEAWQTLRPTASDVSKWSRFNLGVLLGSASGWLVDVDLDCPEAVALAPFYLRDTWVYGRKSNVASHWLYIAEGVHSQTFRDVDGTPGTMMVELRGETDKGPGHQSVIPPSIHGESGEPIEWDADHGDAMELPLRIDAAELTRQVVDLAHATLLVRNGTAPEEARAQVAGHKPKAPPKLVPHAAVRTGVVAAKGSRCPGYRRIPAILCVRTGVVAAKGSRCLTCGTVAESDAGWVTADTCSRACVETRARKYLAMMPAAISGSGGHVATLKAAIAMTRGFELDADTALSLLRDDFNNRCAPPWREADLVHKVKHGAKARAPYGYLLRGRP